MHDQPPAITGCAAPATDAAQWASWATETMRRRLIAFASRTVGDPWEAEDVVQETLLRARESLPTLRERDRGEAWLFRICRHAAIDHVRSRHVRRAVWMPSGPEARPDASRHGHRRDPLPEGEAPGSPPGALPPGLPLRELPAHQRLLVSLHYEHGLSQAVLCRMSGLSAPALRVRLFRARLTLLAAMRRARTAPG